MSQYKKRRRRFPFTPHTTLRPDYCSGGSFFAGDLGSCLLRTGLRLLAPESGKVSQRERGEWESGPGEEWPRRRVAEFLFYISPFCFRKRKCLEHKCLVPSETLCLLPSTLLLFASCFLLLASCFLLLASCFLRLLLKSLTQVVTLFVRLVIREIVFTRMARDVSSRASNRLYL